MEKAIGKSFFGWSVKKESMQRDIRAGLARYEKRFGTKAKSALISEKSIDGLASLLAAEGLHVKRDLCVLRQDIFLEVSNG